MRVRRRTGNHGYVAETEGLPGWVLDEVAHAGRENLDPAHVARYDRKEDAGAGAEVRLLQGLGLDAASTVLDIGAGTGQFALAIAPLCRRVIAVDISPVMFARLQSHVEARGIGEIDCVQAGLLSYDHEGDPVDFAYCRYALHHLPDFWKAIALVRINALLRPGGVLRLWDIVYGFDPDDAPARLEAWCATGGEDVATGWTRPELEEHIRDEHSTYTWLLEMMIARARFTIEEAAYSDDQLSARYVLRKPRRAP
jgi:SAM-dependent methyltransferase